MMRTVALQCLRPDLSDCQIGFGQTVHRRTRPAPRRFVYRSFFAELDVSDKTCRRGNWLFGINRPALLSFHDRDHGDGNNPLRWIGKLLSDAGLEKPHTVRYRGFIRVLGYTFKPVSFWFCLNREGERYAIVAEVNNTFGERHYYLLQAQGEVVTDAMTMSSEKNFHVSPFFDTTGHYRFRFTRRNTNSVARVDYHDDSGLLLATSLSGEHHRVCIASIMRALVGYPFFTLGVIIKIHWQAALLWIGRVPLRTKPDPDPVTVSTGRPIVQQQSPRFTS